MRQRGTAYVLVLAITSLLVTLGFAATQLAQNQIKQGENEVDLAKARLAATYAQDYIHKLMDGETDWRDSHLAATWYSFSTIDGVDIYYTYIDQIDGDLGDDYSQPFLLYTRADSGDATRMFITEYTVDEDHNVTRNASSFRQVVFVK